MTTTQNDKALQKYDQKFRWSMVFMFTFILSGFFVGLYYIVAGKVQTITSLFTFIFFIIGGVGTGPGAHRLFSHHSYKVVRGMKIFIIFCQQISGLKSIISWVRVHRTHHKFTDTERDPTNINRGLFWSAIGCGLTTLPPEAEKEMERIHLDDLFADTDVYFQYKYYPLLYVTITHALPTFIPYYFWNESLHIAFTMNVFRLALNLFQQFIGQGFLHLNGKKTYDKNLTAVDNALYNIFMMGEGYHNFHHSFPFDYRSCEIFELSQLTSLATLFIDLGAFLGLVTDRKVAPPQMIARRITKTGDGSHPYAEKYATDKNLWGYGDPDMSEEDKKHIDFNENYLPSKQS